MVFICSFITQISKIFFFPCQNICKYYSSVFLLHSVSQAGLANQNGSFWEFAPHENAQWVRIEGACHNDIWIGMGEIAVDVVTQQRGRKWVNRHCLFHAKLKLQNEYMTVNSSSHCWLPFGVT